ncbi:MAG TPA: carbohydrate ABC transporter permease [Treponema sp.]|nr:carbohydrate ABC transporter permease [Treponema sp.]
MKSRPASVSASARIERLKAALLIGTFAVFIFVAYVFPVLNLVNVSFKTPSEFVLDPIKPAKAIQFKNYADVVIKNSFFRNFSNSLAYLLFSNLLTLTVTSMAAFIISRKYVKHANFFYILFLAGIFLPDPLIPQFYLLNRLGLYNNPVGYILLKTNPGVIMLMMVGYYKTISREFDEAAAIDGCGTLRYLFQFILPMSMPIFASSVILFSVGVWNDLIGTTVFLTSPRYYPVMRALFQFQGQYGTNWPPLAAAVFIVASPLILLFLFFQRYIISGMVSGGIKG